MTYLFCSNCGQKIVSTARYCQYCGTAQHGVEAMKKKIDTIKQQKDSSNIKTISKKRLCARAVWTFFFSHLAKTSVLLFFTLGLIVVSVVLEVGIGAYLGSLLLIGYILLLYLFSVLQHHNYYYEVNDSAFQKEYGIIHKTNVTIPFSTIQNVNISRSLSDRMFGLARIDIESAGSSGQNGKTTIAGSLSTAEGHLPGVTLMQAKEIHDILVKRFSGENNT